MATYYIDDSATGSNNGGSGNDAWQTIAAAVATTFSPGDEIIFVAGSGPYREQFNPGITNGTAENPVTWKTSSVGQKVKITCMDDANGVDVASGNNYQWNLSGSGTNEYYLTINDATTVVPAEVKSVVIDGYYMGSSAGDDRDARGHERGTVGSLLNLQYGWGNNDSLSGNTLYARFDDNSPSSHEVSINRRTLIHSANRNYQDMEDLIFEGGDDFGCKPREGWHYRRCAFMYQDNSGVAVSSSRPVAPRAISCLFYFCGHQAVQASGTGNLEVYNCTDFYAHLFARIDSGASTASLTLINNISAQGEAGAISNDSATATLVENNNLFYPFMNASGGALGYLGTANWATTDATDIPANRATIESDQGTLQDPVFSAPNTLSFNAEDYRLKSTSPALGKGANWWTSLGEVPLDYFGNPINSSNHLGAMQIVVGASSGGTFSPPQQTQENIKKRRQEMGISAKGTPVLTEKQKEVPIKKWMQKRRSDMKKPKWMR